jgi:hypothetical protein
MSINQLSNAATSVWNLPAGVVGGEQLSLNDIEHVKLRSIWNEPTIHACIVCASASCPNLKRQAFEGPDLERQMKQQMADWLANPTKGCKQSTLSRIFLWFESDFGGKQGVLNFLREYGIEMAQPRLDYFPYDWQINRLTLE